MAGLMTPAAAAAQAVPAVVLPGTVVASPADYASADNRDILVTAAAQGYQVPDSASATKTETPIIDIPQSISVLSAEQLADQAVRSMADLVRLVPGVSAGQGEGHRDQVTLRGNNSTADFFVDGLRDDVQYYRSFYNIDRVEVLRGSNAMIFGRGGGGGVINRVTKGADGGRSFADLTASVDSFGAWYAALDANQPLSADGRAAVRVNAFYEDLANHRDRFDGERWGVNPTIAFEFAGGNKVELAYEHVADDRIVDRGIPSRGGAPLPGYRDAFFGDADANRTNFNGDVVRLHSNHELTSALTLSTNLLYGDYDKGYSNVFASSAVRDVAGQAVVDVQAYRDLSARENWIAQANLAWRGSTGAIDHVLLIGAEYSNQSSRSERINGFFGTSGIGANRTRTVALADPFVTPAVSFIPGAAANGNRAATSQLDQVSLYAQEQLSFGDAIDVIAGLRYDRFALTVGNVFAGTSVRRVDHLWSPRIGVVGHPAEGVSLYASWSVSHLPQAGDQFTTLDATTATLAPERFENWEVGAKLELRPGLLLTGALFQLDRTNTRAAGPVPGTIVLTGEQRSRGAELTLTGRLLPQWQIAAGYGYTEAEVRAGDNAGRQVAQVPRHTLSLWNRYDVTPQFGVGAGLIHQSGSFATIGNTVRLPAWTRIDAALYYDVSDRLSLQLNVENLANADYFPLAHNDNNITPGAPRNARVTVNYRF